MDTSNGAHGIFIGDTPANELANPTGRPVVEKPKVTGNPLLDDVVKTQPVRLKLWLNPEEIKLLEVRALTLQMSVDAYVTGLVKGSIR